MIEKDNNKQPFFSIIMPCYNSEKYLDYAIKSVILQTFTDWELIAINDGSTDRTEEMLRAYSGKDDRIKVFSKQNGGYCSAVNAGLNSISGKYFLFMGSDDALSENLLGGIFAEAEKRYPDLIGFRSVKVIDGVPEGLDGFTKFDSFVYEIDTSIKDFESAHGGHARIFFVRDTSKCYKTELLGDLRYFGKYGFDADGIFSMLFAHKCRSFMSLPIDGYLWTLRSDSLSGRTVTAEVYEDRLDNWKRFYSVIKTLDASEISKTEKNYVDYYWVATRRYAKIVFENKMAGKKRFLRKHTRFMFFTMRRYGITVGKTALEKIKNYIYLIFPIINKKIYKSVE